MLHDYTSDAFASPIMAALRAMGPAEAAAQAARAEAKQAHDDTATERETLIDSMRDLAADAAEAGMDMSAKRISWFDALGAVLGHVALIELRAPTMHAIRRDDALNKRLQRAWSKARNVKRSALESLTAALDAFEKNANASEYAPAAAILTAKGATLSEVAATFAAMLAEEADAA